jgi:hypothetical protein
VSAGQSLGELQSWRVAADYHLDSNRAATRESAKLAVEMAHTVQAQLEQCRQEPTKSAVKAGIEAYRHRIGGSLG